MILDKDALKKIADEVIAKYSSNDTIRTDIVHITEELGFTAGEFTKKADFNSLFPHIKRKSI